MSLSQFTSKVKTFCLLSVLVEFDYSRNFQSCTVCMILGYLIVEYFYLISLYDAID